MKSEHFTNPTKFYIPSSVKAGQDPEIISRQIEALRVVMRRMKSSQSPSVEAIIQQKLKELT